MREWFRRLGLGARSRRPLEARFTEVFEKRLWASTETVSGYGSERASGQVAHTLDLLRRMVRELDVRSITDVPCGDFNWMPMLLDDHPHIDYIGYDVVTPLILDNRRRHPERRFELLDITVEAPRRSDLILTKDLLNHLSERDVWAALGNMIACGARYLMISNNRGFDNVELAPGFADASRCLDLFGEPYGLPDALYADHYLAVWEAEAVARRLEARRR